MPTTPVNPRERAVIHADIGPGLYQKTIEAAKAQDRSLASVVRQALREHLRTREEDRSG